MQRRNSAAGIDAGPFGNDSQKGKLTEEGNTDVLAQHLSPCYK